MVSHYELHNCIFRSLDYCSVKFQDIEEIGRHTSSDSCILIKGSGSSCEICAL